MIGRDDRNSLVVRQTESGRPTLAGDRSVDVFPVQHCECPIVRVQQVGRGQRNVRGENEQRWNRSLPETREARWRTAAPRRHPLARTCARRTNETRTCARRTNESRENERKDGRRDEDAAQTKTASGEATTFGLCNSVSSKRNENFSGFRKETVAEVWIGFTLLSVETFSTKVSLKTIYILFPYKVHTTLLHVLYWNKNKNLSCPSYKRLTKIFFSCYFWRNRR